ncbi:MAG: FtsH protease activity modulator HflK [Deltaproteobacteria bacterium]|nr:FtsH protease activity modulator HflK [Deltaproteobacteria bacterium]
MALSDSGRKRQRWSPGNGDWEEIKARLPDFPWPSQKGVLALVIAGLLLWAATGIYIVGPGEQGVVLQFGRVLTTTGPGLNYRLPWPVQQSRVVNVEAIQRLEVGFRSDPRRPGTVRTIPTESLMLTGDENIVDAQLIIQYRISEPIRYLFHLRDPLQTLRAATEVALRSRVGNMTIDDVLTVGRAKVQDETRQFLQELMSAYQSGLLITDVKLQAVDAPEQVKDAFHEVVRAREDREKMINQARGYYEDVIPKARGEAQEILRAAEAYKEERTLRARGDAARFSAVLTEYRKAPVVTRTRLHLETVEKLLAKSDKIIMESKGGAGVLPLLPLKDINIRQESSGASKETKGGQP